MLSTIVLQSKYAEGYPVLEKNNGREGEMSEVKEGEKRMSRNKSEELLKRFYTTAQDEYIKLRISESDNSTITSGLIFTEWYFKMIEGRNRDEIEEIVTDGPQDNGIDALFFDEGTKLIRLFQFKSGKSLKQDGWLKFQNGVNKYRQYFSDSGMDNPKDAFGSVAVSEKLLRNFKITKNKVDSLIENDDFYNGIEINIVSNSVDINDNIRKEIEEYVRSWKRAGGNIKLNILLNNNIYKRFFESIHSVNIGKVALKFSKPPIELVESDFREFKSLKIFAGVMNGAELAKLYKLHREKLLQKNVRIYKDNSPINKDIYKTAIDRNEGNPFLFFNNGITIVTESVELATQVLLGNPQIVNGGQTIRSIYKAYKDGKLNENIQVQIRIINIGNEPKIASMISTKLNTQTNIDSQDVIAFLEVILILDELLRVRKYYFERRTDEFNSLEDEEKAALANEFGISISSLKSRVVPFKVLLQYITITLKDKVIQVKREYNKFMEPKILEDILFQIQVSEPSFIFNLYQFCDTIKEFINENRKRNKSTISWYDENMKLNDKYGKNKIKEIISNSSLVSQSLIYHYYTQVIKINVSELKEKITKDNGYLLFMESIEMIAAYEIDHPDEIDAKWRTLLLRPTFFPKVLDWVLKDWNQRADKTIVFDLEDI